MRVILCLICLSLIKFVFCSPPMEEINLPLLEEQTKGSEVHDFMDEVPLNERSGISFKLINQYMTFDENVVDADTQWVKLNEKSGVMSVATPVDREQYCNTDPLKQCAIHVKVVRQPQRVLQLFDVTLNIIDINDHAPVFPVSPVIEVKVSEAAPITTRINLDRYLASDLDIGSNSAIYYTLTRNEFFSIHSFTDKITGDPHLQLVVNNQLDHESSFEYDLTLTATDRGSPQQQSSSVTLKVIITDANDNFPVFDKTVYHVQLKENVDPGLVIATVHAEDYDTNSFGEVRYFIPDSGNSIVAQNLISVDPVSGKVTLKETLDRERHNNLRVIIAARDLAPEDDMKVGKTFLSIEVEDENDNPPTILVNIIVEKNGSIVYIPESSSIDTYIAQVTADDIDAGKNAEVSLNIFTYPILPNNEDSIFSLSNNEYFDLEEGGFIKIRSELDRETIPEYLIVIRACDDGILFLCSTKNLTVIVIDVNDNSPEFVSLPKSIVLSEDTDFGTVIAQVQATDGDSINAPSFSLNKDGNIEKSTNGIVRYELHGGGNCFVIDKVTGKIKLIRKLDYERKKSWKMFVTAWDMGNPRNSANLSVNVDVTDVNDNIPIFTTPSEFNQTVAATIQSGDVFLKADDADGGIFSQIYYSILPDDDSSDSPQIFILDKNNGNLRLNMSNRNLISAVGSHNLIIKAQDSGVPSLFDTTALNVEVFNVPLNKLPTFTRVKEDIKKEDKDLSVVLIASLASSALILVIIFAAVIFKCRKDKKENRSYNCRRANLHNSFSSNNDGQKMSDGGKRIPLQFAVASRASSFNSLNCNKRKDLRSTTDSNDITSKCFRSRPSSQMSQKKTNALIRSGSTPLTVDRDSGRGDSDHETESYEEKTTIATDQKYADNRHFVKAVPLTCDLGPMCTHLCQQYGHSDSCWMPNEGVHTNSFVSPMNYHHDYSPFEVYEGGAISGRLETINETQPLHYVLDTGYPDVDSEYYCQLNDSRVMLLNGGDVEYHQPQYKSVTNVHFYHSPNNVRLTPTSTHNFFHNGEGSQNNQLYSPSEHFHDGYNITDSSSAHPMHSLVYFPPKQSIRNDDSFVPSTVQTSQPVSPPARQRLSPLEEVNNFPDTTQYQTVSLEETQKIIDNIEKLIEE